MKKVRVKIQPFVVFVSGIFSLIILSASKTRVDGLNCKVLMIFKSTRRTLIESKDEDTWEKEEAELYWLIEVDDGIKFSDGVVNIVVEVTGDVGVSSTFFVSIRRCSILVVLIATMAFLFLFFFFLFSLFASLFQSKLLCYDYFWRK